jgi:SAM-dependent methyltransferase
MPDSALDADALAERLDPLLRDVDAYLAPWSDDPHPDHAAAGRAAAAAAPVHAHGWEYPIWMWVRTRPDDPAVPWPRAVHYALTDRQRRLKRRAVGCFVSQLEPAPGGGPPILPEQVLPCFDTPTELYFRVARETSAPVRRFEQLYARGDGDPWQTRTSWYEQRKQAVTVACLPRARYRHAAEPGCGLGTLTPALAQRCDRVDASDYSAGAVEAAARATGHLPGVTVTARALPDPAALPAGIDLAMLSEVLYYLSPADVGAVVDRLADALVPGGDAVLAHWRGWPAEAPQDAARTHAQVLADPRFEMLVEHTDEKFLLHVVRRR